MSKNTKKAMPTVNSVQPTLCLNICRDGKPFQDKKAIQELALAMLDGWRVTEPVEVVPFGDLSSEEQDSVTSERVGRVHPLLGDGGFSVVLPKKGIDGKIIDSVKVTVSESEIEAEIIILYGTSSAMEDITHVTNDGTRRHYVLPLVNVLRAKLDLPRITDIPYVVSSYSKPVERDIANFRANSVNGKASVVITVALIRLVCELKSDKYLLNMAEIARRLGLKNGTKQTTDYASQIVREHPEIGLLEGMRSGIYHNVNNGLGKFINGLATSLKKGSLKEDYTEQDIIGYLIAEKQVKQKMLPRSEIEYIVSHNRCKGETKILSCVLNNDKARLGDFIEKYGKGISAIMEFIDNGGDIAELSTLTVDAIPSQE